MKKAYNIILVIGLLIFSISISLHWTTGHRLNGDFALYINQALALIENKQEELALLMKDMLRNSTYKEFSPILYPWGVPFFLTLPISLFGINYEALRGLLALMLILSWGMLWYYLKLKKKYLIGGLTLLLLSGNTIIPEELERIISTIPYLFCLTGYFLFTHLSFLDRDKDIKAIPFLIFSGIFLFLSYETRTEGILLIPSYFIFLLIVVSSKQKPVYILGLKLIPVLIILLLILATISVFPSGWENHWHSIHLNLSSNTLFYYIHTIPNLCYPFLPATGFIKNIIFWFFLLIGIIVTGKNFLLEKIYTILHISLFLFYWPFTTSRYIYPLIPFLTYWSLYGLFNTISNMIPYKKVIYGIIGCSLIFLQYISCAYNIISRPNPYSTFDVNITAKNTTEMFDFLRDYTSKKDIIACSESRAINLYTHKKSYNLYKSISEIQEKADWYVFFRKREHYLQIDKTILFNHPEIFKEKFKNSDFIIYKIIKK